MMGLGNLIRRNCKLFFKDKGVFFTSLVTPLILLVLYATFLAKVYRDAFLSSVPDFLVISDNLIDGLVGGELLSSLLAVSAVTVSFCSNMIMVADKFNGAIGDLRVSPVRRSVLAISYYLSTVIVTLIVCYTAMGIGFLYLWRIGWYLSVTDILLLILDIFLMVLFGTALSSIINVFLTTQGQMSAVGTIISSGYGFICGAYMPISNFGSGLQRVVSFLPGTYGTSVIRNHSMRGALTELGAQGIPADVIEKIKDSIDCNLYFFDHPVSMAAMYGIVGISVLLLVTGYVLLNVWRNRKS